MQITFICIATFNRSSMKMRVCLCLILPLVMVSGLQSQQLKTHLFTKVNHYSGFACVAKYRVFDIEKARSRSDCVIACANFNGCSAIFYVESSNRCIGCISANVGLEKLTGSVCYLKGPGCPEGWIRYSHSCYNFDFNIQMNFTDAKEHCSSMGAHVIVPDDADENHFIKTRIPLGANWGTWIGIEEEPLNTWLSYHDKKTVTYLPWTSGEPNGHMAELCVAWENTFNLHGMMCHASGTDL